MEKNTQQFCALSEKNCKPCEGGVSPLESEEVKVLLKEIPNWQTDETGKAFIFRIFEFKNYYKTMAFVNAIAWIAHIENHHPDLEVSYNQCIVFYSTHAIKGLSENDFICAAKINKMLE